MTRRIPALGLAFLIYASSSTPGGAQAVNYRRVPSIAMGTGVPHRIFGRMVNASGTLLVIQLRSGRLLKVDITRAFALKRVAQPFFRGKPTVVDGSFGSAGVFYATAVKRIGYHPQNWGADQ